MNQHHLDLLYRTIHDRPGRHPPSPRPDLLVRRRDGTCTAVFDTKYKDLWAAKIPREILYQMSVYALAYPTTVATVILYPRPHASCHDITYALDVRGQATRRIILRGIDWQAAITTVQRDDQEAGRRLARSWIGQMPAS